MRILVPTDFSESARNAFDYGYQLSIHEPDVEFILLNSYEMPKGGSAGGVMMNLEEAMAKESVRDLSLELKHFSTEYPNAKIKTVSRYGTLENSVARTNNEENVDFVVMGTHGASGLKKALIGSNTQTVIENIVRPVISVPKNWKFRPIKNIVYATDLHVLDNPGILDPICTLAKMHNAVIHVVYITEDASTIDLEKELEDTTLNKQFAERERKFKVVEAQSVVDGIDSYVKEVDADLVVLVPKQATFWHKLFNRSLTEQLAFQAKTPMLSLKDI